MAGWYIRFSELGRAARLSSGNLLLENNLSVLSLVYHQINSPIDRLL